MLDKLPNVRQGCNISIDGECNQCPHYRSVLMENPQTGEKTNEWDCVLAWMVAGVLDNGRKSVGIQAAVESSRNEANRRQDEFFDVLAQGVLSAVDTRLEKPLGRPVLSPSLQEQQERQRQLYHEQGSYEQSQVESDEDRPPNGQ